MDSLVPGLSAMNPIFDWTVKSPSLVPSSATVDVRQQRTAPPDDAPNKKACKQRLAEDVERFADFQEKLYAQDSMSLLLVFQAMDAAGKDSTIRAVTTGVNPAGFQVHSFKKPSSEELDHDFLWRCARARLGGAARARQPPGHSAAAGPLHARTQCRIVKSP